MTGDGFVLGVDLGTSHTVAVLRHPDGRVRPLLFDGQPLLPSAVYLDTTGRLHVGRDAVRLGLAEPARIEPNPKRRIDDGTALLGGAEVPVADLLAALLGAVAREAVAITGQLPPAVLTHPASWGAPRRAVLAEALAKAGWPADTRLIPEPVAAARYFAGVLRRPVPVGGSLAVFDFGGGTLDVAVVRNDGGHYTVTASGGADDLGGLDLDAALVDHLAKSLSAAEPDAWKILEDPATLGQWRARRQFWEDVRGAKEMLSRSSFAPLPVPGVEQAVHLTREELEAAADPLVRRGVAEAADVIAATGLAPGDLSGLFLVGGSSRVPLVARLLHAELGIAPTVLEQPELPVAEGALLADPPTPGDVHYSQGLAAAATPPQALAPASSPQVPAQRVSPEDTDDRVLVQPVDPWATGEAAAGGPVYPSPPMSSTGGGNPPTPPGPGGPMTALGSGPLKHQQKPHLRTYAIIAASTVLVLAAGGIAAWYLWPRYPALDYRSSLPAALHVKPDIPVGDNWSDAEVTGDRAYFASARDDGSLEVIAANTGNGDVAWHSTAAGSAETWKNMYPLASGVALIGQTQSGSQIMAVLSGKTGDAVLTRNLTSDQQVWFVDGEALIADSTSHRLTAYDLSNGKQRWDMATLHGEYSGDIALYPVTTPKDLSGPSTVDGRPLSPDDGDDRRAVVIGPDSSASVIDLDNGKTLTERNQVAATDDEVVAHNGHLYVAESGGTPRIVVYRLDKLDQPQEIYRTQLSGAELQYLAPCGDNRICFVESAGSSTSNVVAASADGKGGWRVAVADVNQTLVPVGDGVLASAYGKTTLIDGNGKKIWDNEQAAGRIDAANVLAFRQTSDSPSDDAITGQHLGDSPVSIGSFDQVRSSTCSWNTSALACVGDQDFVIVKYVK